MIASTVIHVGSPWPVPRRFAMIGLVRPALAFALLFLALPLRAHADESPQEQPGLLGAGFHLQIGLGIGETLAGEPIRVQPHPRATLRYDHGATMAWRLVGRHQRISEDGGHAEFTVSPAVLRRWRLSNSVRVLAGAGLSAGAFVRFLPRNPDALEQNSEYAIPITGEVSGSLVWQWKSAASFELAIDYRPVFFSDGDVEHLLSQSISISLDF